jgi:hypothetical protein
MAFCFYLLSYKMKIILSRVPKTVEYLHAVTSPSALPEIQQALSFSSLTFHPLHHYKSILLKFLSTYTPNWQPEFILLVNVHTVSRESQFQHNLSTAYENELTYLYLTWNTMIECFGGFTVL